MKDLFKKLIKLTDNKEDFFTECLAAALRSDQVLAVDFINLILGNKATETKGKGIGDIKIDTQVKYDKGRSIPDMIISVNTLKLCIENKLWADEGEGQISKYLSLGEFDALAFITAADGYSIDKRVLDDPVYRKPTRRDHFVWEDIYPIIEKGAKVPGSHPVVLAMQGLFEFLSLDPAPQIEGLFPPEEWTIEHRRRHYNPFWAPTIKRLTSSGWGNFQIHPWPRMAQIYAKICPHPQFKELLLEVGTKPIGTSYVRATVTLHSENILMAFSNALKQKLYEQLPSTEIYHQSKNNKIFIVTPLRPFIENLSPIQIHHRLADHFGCIADAANSVMVLR